MKRILAYFLINFCFCNEISEEIIEKYNITASKSKKDLSELKIKGWPNDILNFSNCTALKTTDEITENKLRTMLFCNVTFELAKEEPQVTTTAATTTGAPKPETPTTVAPTITTKATTTTTKATSTPTTTTTKATTTTKKKTTTTTDTSTPQSPIGNETTADPPTSDVQKTDEDNDKEIRKTNAEKIEDNKKKIIELIVAKEVEESSVPIFRTWGGAVFLHHMCLAIAVLIIWSNQISLGKIFLL